MRRLIDVSTPAAALLRVSGSCGAPTFIKLLARDAASPPLSGSQVPVLGCVGLRLETHGLRRGHHVIRRRLATGLAELTPECAVGMVASLASRATLDNVSRSDRGSRIELNRQGRARIF